jgi:hypothetical protein
MSDPEYPSLKRESSLTAQLVWPHSSVLERREFSMHDSGRNSTFSLPTHFRGLTSTDSGGSPTSPLHAGMGMPDRFQAESW